MVAPRIITLPEQLFHLGDLAEVDLPLSSSTLAEDDKMLVASPSLAAPRNRTILLSVLRTFIDFKVNSVSEIILGSLRSAVHIDDFFVIGDVSDPGGPNKRISVHELRKVLNPTPTVPANRQGGNRMSWQGSGYINRPFTQDPATGEWAWVVGNTRVTTQLQRAVTTRASNTELGDLLISYELLGPNFLLYTGNGGRISIEQDNVPAFPPSRRRFVTISSDGYQTIAQGHLFSTSGRTSSLDPLPFGSGGTTINAVRGMTLAAVTLPEATRPIAGGTITYEARGAPSWLNVVASTRMASSSSVPASALTTNFVWIATDGTNYNAATIRVFVTGAVTPPPTPGGGTGPPRPTGPDIPGRMSRVRGPGDAHLIQEGGQWVFGFAGRSRATQTIDVTTTRSGASVSYYYYGPSWMSLSGGTLSIVQGSVPSTEDARKANFTVVASDGYETTSYSAVTARSVANAPINGYPYVSRIRMTKGQSFTPVTVTAASVRTRSPTPAGPITYQAVALPTWLDFDSSTRQISLASGFTTVPSTAYSTEFVVMATDGTNYASTRAFVTVSG